MISITIPTYEMNGIGKLFFENSLTYISKQTFRDFEVVVSDHSESNEILDICLKFNELDINYVKNKNNKGSSSANLNNAIKHSKYNIIKFLMQDEYLYDENTLLDIKKIFEDENINWVVTGCLYGSSPEKQIGKMLPFYNDNIIIGNNTIGSPSVVTIRKTNQIELFNQDLLWLMDCEYYKRLYDKWGNPTIIPEYKIFINQHENQVTNIISPNLKKIETELMRSIYIKR